MATRTNKKTGKKKAGTNGSVRDRVPGLKVNEGGKKKKGKKEPERTPGKMEDYLAAMLHEERGKVMELRKVVLNKDNEILKLKQENLQTQLALVNAEQADVNKKNAELRERHGLSLGGSIHLDDETGEVYRLETPEKN